MGKYREYAGLCAACAVVLCAGGCFMGNINRNSEMEEMNMESETDMKNNSLKVCEDYLKKEISNEMPLESIVNVFEKMCEIPADDEMILFETGTFPFTGKSQFYFSLVRQIPDGEGEYIQLHAEKNSEFEQMVWSDEFYGLEENIFDYIRKSDVFNSVKEDTYESVDIYVDET